MILNTLSAMVLGLCINMLNGRPKFFKTIENFILSVSHTLEQKLTDKYKDTPDAQRVAGGVHLIIMLAIFALIPLGLIILGYLLQPVAGILLETFIFWFCLDLKTARVKTSGIMRSLKSGNVAFAKKKLRDLTDSDTSLENEQDIVRNTVEYTADISVNGGYAPLFYMAIFGGFGAVFYKVLWLLNNENEKNATENISFGKAAKKLWSALGIIPAYIGSWFTLADVKFLMFDMRNAKRIHKRDHQNADPKFLGEVRSVVAGALGIRLNPVEVYDGGIYRQKAMGYEFRQCSANDIHWANQLFYGGVFSLFVICAVLRAVVFLIF
ncbi:MAG: cobalamin biosynthesis protein [Oscillospiraceae bacterium]